MSVVTRPLGVPAWVSEEVVGKEMRISACRGRGGRECLRVGASCGTLLHKQETGIERTEGKESNEWREFRREQTKETTDKRPTKEAGIRWKEPDEKRSTKKDLFK